MANNPKLFREMVEPFESRAAADLALEAFYADLADLRKKHKITNLLVTAAGFYIEGDDEPEFMTSTFFGDSLRAELMAAWTLGREQTFRQDRVGELMKAAIKDRHPRKGQD